MHRLRSLRSTTKTRHVAMYSPIVSGTFILEYYIGRRILLSFNEKRKKSLFGDVHVYQRTFAKRKLAMLQYTK